MHLSVSNDSDDSAVLLDLVQVLLNLCLTCLIRPFHRRFGESLLLGTVPWRCWWVGGGASENSSWGLLVGEVIFFVGFTLFIVWNLPQSTCECVTTDPPSPTQRGIDSSDTWQYSTMPMLKHDRGYCILPPRSHHVTDMCVHVTPQLIWRVSAKRLVKVMSNWMKLLYYIDYITLYLW